MSAQMSMSKEHPVGGANNLERGEKKKKVRRQKTQHWIEGSENSASNYDQCAANMRLLRACIMEHWAGGEEGHEHVKLCAGVGEDRHRD